MTPEEFRKHLHRHPELSFAEHRTAAFIAEQLQAAGIEYRTIAGTGILARIEGALGDKAVNGDDIAAFNKRAISNDAAAATYHRNKAAELENAPRAVVLRADIDALPICEQTGLEYASQNEGVMHACGHDIHAAVLYGVLCRLAADRNFHGTVFGLFQPGEERNPGGASLVLEENPFEGYNITAMVGEHTDAQLEVGEFGFREGKYMASSDELRFTVHGTGGHAAMRQNIIDPIIAAAQLTLHLTGLNRLDKVLSIGKVDAQGATNIIPESVYMEGTLRTFDEQERECTKTTIRQTAQAIDRRYGTHTDVDIDSGYPCVVNDPHLTAAAYILAQKLYTAKKLPLRTTAEDFGFYCKHYPSLFYRLGVGTKAGKSHSSTFAPNQGAISVGIDFMHRLTLKFTEDYDKKQNK